MTRGTMSQAQALDWVARWEAMMHRYLPRRAAVHDEVLDAVAAHCPQPRRLVDIGGGPGTLAARAAARFPHTEVLVVERDPVLIMLGAAAHPHLGWLEADVATGWEGLASLGAVDAVLTVMTLHMLDDGGLTRLVSALAGLLRPGGVLVDHDQEHDGDAAAPARLWAERASSPEGTAAAEQPDRLAPAEDWTGWWTAVSRVDDLREALAHRRSTSSASGGGSSAARRVAVLEAGGFTSVEAARQPDGRCWRITAVR